MLTTRFRAPTWVDFAYDENSRTAKASESLDERAAFSQSRGNKITRTSNERSGHGAPANFTQVLTHTQK
jgi:hypothetical protein